MSMLASDRRPGPRGASKPGPAPAPEDRAGSIRQVCLIGRPPGAGAAPSRLEWAGRSYRVVGAGPRHLHLAPEDDPAGSG